MKRVDLPRQGDAWKVGIARNPVFSCTKWLPASMSGTLFVRRVRLLFVLRSDASSTTKLNAGLQIAVEWLHPCC